MTTEANAPTKVYVKKSYEGGTISSAEAEFDGISTENLHLASLEDCKKQVVQGEDGFDMAYLGPIEVQEGCFEFNFDLGKYQPA